MKKTVFIFLVLFSIFKIAEAQEVVKVGAFNFYPGIFKDSDGQIKGFYVDAFNEIGRKENIKFVFVYGSWDEGLERIKTGEIDLLTSVAITEDRLQYMDYTTTPLLTVWSEVYVNPKTEIHGVLDLEGKSIAIMKSDYNGNYLKQLIKKLEIKCTFVEAPDFEEVFKLIVEKKVDAGVVNNTFGASKSEEYELMSSGIILNPFDIFLSVKKDTKKELLDLLDKYLKEWKHDRNSVFNVSRQKWTHEKIGTIEVFPHWLMEGIYTSLLIVLILILFIGLLRFQVKKARRKIERSEQLFKTFMENTPAYVYIKNSNLNHVYRNRMVNTVNKVSAEEQNSSAKTVFEPHVAALVEKTDLEILTSQTSQINIQYECMLNNKKTWLHDYKFLIQLPDGKAGIGGISFDITKLKETESELIKAKEKAEESDRLKSAFLANMSHEIRTPMNGILGFVSLLKEPHLSDEEQQKYIEIIDRSGDRMLNIIKNIIDISKIESGTTEIQLNEINIYDQLQFVYDLLKTDAENKKLNLSFKCVLPEKETIIKTDSEKFYGILSNLVKNAIKYTETGFIEFGVSKHTDHGFSEYQFYVKDSGIGIPKEKCNVVFERFVQADIDDKMAKQGAGLGLAISKAYVEMLGGKIWVESEEGVGSAFFFTLPSNIDDERTATPLYLNEKDANPNTPDFSCLKVLIVEDDEASELFISIELKKYCKEILKARTGKDAFETYLKNPDIDLVLMDIQMPEMNGYEATRKIREVNKDVIIIAQTAFALSGDREKAIQAGCNDYITKPINKEKLLALIQSFFNN